MLHNKPYRLVLWPIIALGAVVLIFFHPQLSASQLLSFVAFLAMTLIAEAWPDELPNGKASMSIGFAIVFAGTLVFGAGAGAWLAAIGTLSIDQLRGKHPLEFVLFNRAQLAIAGMTAGVFFSWAGGVPGPLNLRLSWLAVVAASLGYLLANAALVLVAMSAVYQMPIKDAFARYRRTLFSTNYLVLIPLAILIAMVQSAVGLLGVFLFFVPLAVSRLALQRSITTERLQEQTIDAVVAAIEARDEYTSGHSQRVKQLAVAVAKEMRLSGEMVVMIDYLSGLHDIGKIGIRDEILRKPGPLTSDEFAEIRQHPVMGATILGHIEDLEKAVNMVTHHHERYDGKGYPTGLAGEEIPLGARIIGVCDAFDAMTSHRPYRPTMTEQEALLEVQRCSGTQFDPKIVKAFLKVMDPLGVGRKRD